MALRELDSELGKKRLRRVLIIGGTNKLKTTSIVRTFPKPMHILSYPGEKGSGVIPTSDPQIKAYVWEEESQVQKTPTGEETKIITSYTQQIRDIEQTTWDILAGNKGPIKTFAGDGFHRLASLYWNREYQRLLVAYESQIAAGGKTKEGEPQEEALKLRAYGNENFGAYRDIMAYVSKVLQSNVDTVVFTCWEGVEPEDKVLSDAPSSRHIFAELPGRLARNISGEFAVTLYAETSLPGPTGLVTGTWQIRKSGKVWGVGVKTPYDIAIKLPDKVPMDWSRLYPVLAGEADPSTLKSEQKPITQPKPAAATKPVIPVHQ